MPHEQKAVLHRQTLPAVINYLLGKILSKFISTNNPITIPYFCNRASQALLSKIFNGKTIDC